MNNVVLKTYPTKQSNFTVEGRWNVNRSPSVELTSLDGNKTLLIEVHEHGFSLLAMDRLDQTLEINKKENDEDGYHTV